LFGICENAEKVVQWCISLGIIFDLAGEISKKCINGHFVLRKDILFQVTDISGSVVIKNVESFNT